MGSKSKGENGGIEDWRWGSGGGNGICDDLVIPVLLSLFLLVLNPTSPSERAVAFGVNHHHHHHLKPMITSHTRDSQLNIIYIFIYIYINSY